MSDQTDHERRRFLGAAAVGVAASLTKLLFADTASAGEHMMDAFHSSRLPASAPPSTESLLHDEGRMPELAGAVGWLNSPPLTRESLHGKVVLVDIWTYSCINSLRQLPYLRRWAAKYRDAGLVVIGVHSPEFGFEKERPNVERAVREMNVGYPIAIDSNQGVWRAFDNQYWPADYFIDAKGRIRHHHFGEGDYDESERVIQDLLRENGAKSFVAGGGNVANSPIEVAPNWPNVRTPETYVGYNRGEHFASPQHVARDSRASYTVPQRLSLNQWALGGEWNLGGERGVLEGATGKIAFRFHSRDLHCVLAPRVDGTPVHFKVTLDGAAPGEDHGADTAADGRGEIREPRLYQLVRQKNGGGNDRTFEIEFLDPGVQAYVFTFG
jgi:thiol-disulfide isomerase/thioredoxin